MIRALDRHWFAPARLRDLAFIRILVFGTQTGVFLWFPDGRIRSLDEQLRQAALGTHLYDPLPVLRLLLLGTWQEHPPSAAVLTATYVLAIVAGVLATVGLLSRTTMLAAAWAHTVLVAHHYSYGEFHHAEALFIVALWVLALGPSARALSLDAWFRRSRSGRTAPEVSGGARWPLRLLQWMLALSYLSAALAKWVLGGPAWVNGHTLTFGFAAVALHTGREIPALLSTLPPALFIVPSALAWVTEAGFVGAVFARRYVWVFLAAGTVLHLGVYVTMGIAFCQTLLLYSVFVVNWRDSREAAPGLSARPHQCSS